MKAILVSVVYCSGFRQREIIRGGVVDDAGLSQF